MKSTFNRIKLFSILIFAFCLFNSCASSKIKEEEKTFTSIPYLIEENVQFEELEDPSQPYRYIFIRLYNPIYSNPLYIANILKGGISITEVNDYELSHASISTSLDDGFYGLTLAGKSQFVKEYCTDVNSNGYMSHCNPDNSDQITFAIRVSEKEFNDISNYIDFYSKYPPLTYKALYNFKIAVFSIDRKFFTKKSHKNFGDIKYPKSKKAKKKAEKEGYIEKDFVCSTFTAYILINNVKKIRNWFEEKNVNYRYVNVTDIPYIPGVVPLFYSTWTNYNVAAELFVESNPEFKQYLNN